MTLAFNILRFILGLPRLMDASVKVEHGGILTRAWLQSWHQTGLICTKNKKSAPN